MTSFENRFGLRTNVEVYPTIAVFVKNAEQLFHKLVAGAALIKKDDICKLRKNLFGSLSSKELRKIIENNSGYPIVIHLLKKILMSYVASVLAGLASTISWSARFAKNFSLLIWVGGNIAIIEIGLMPVQLKVI